MEIKWERKIKGRSKAAMVEIKGERVREIK